MRCTVIVVRSGRFAAPALRCVAAAVLLGAALLAGRDALASGRHRDRTAAGGGTNGPVRALAVYGSQLVLGGDFTTADGVTGGASYIAAWDGLNFVPLGQGLDGPVSALVVLGNDLIAGGDFTHAGGAAADHIARWDGNAWSPLGSGMNGPVRALLVQAGIVLIVGGQFTQAGGVPANSVARWLASTWSPMGFGMEGEVRSLAFNGVSTGIVAGGDFMLKGSPDSTAVLDRYIALFNGSRWIRLATAIDSTVSSVTSYNGALAMGGAFRHADVVTPADRVARLVGDTWSNLGQGFSTATSDSAEVLALQAHGDTLFAGGTFLRADFAPMANIARWDGTSWTSVGAGFDAAVQALTIYKGCLIAGGAFTHSGGTLVNHLASFVGGVWEPFVHTPIGVQDLEAAATDGRVHLAWKLPAESRASLLGLRVQRADTFAGPFAVISGEALTPGASMSFEDADIEPAHVYWYRLELLTRDAVATLVGPIEVRTADLHPARTALHAPRETGPGAPIWIGYRLAGSAGRVSLDLYDARGKRLRRLDSGRRESGEHVRMWDRRDEAGALLPRGVYFVHLRASDAAATRKLVLLHP